MIAVGILHRLYTRHAAAVWQAETRLLHRLGYVRPPRAVQWLATSMCDLHCPHCYSHAGKRSPDELDVDEAKTHILDELVALGRPNLVIAGGEALLRRDFEAIVAHAHRRKIPWALHTHGGRVDALIDVFERYPPVMVAVSLDGPRAYHDSFRGREGSFAAAVAAITALKRIGVPEVVTGTTVNRDNADLLADMISDVLATGADSWGSHLVTPEGRAGQGRAMLPTAAQLRRVAGLARRLRALIHVELDNEWGSAGDDDCFYRDQPFLCGAGRHVCVITPTGEVVPCTTTDRRESHGNVRTRRLRDIWADGFAAFREAGDRVKADGLDCWLQTRNGHSCRGPAFFGAPGTELGDPPLVTLRTGGAS